MKNTLLSLRMIKFLFEKRFWRRELAFAVAAFLLGTFSTFAQAPNAFTFQGVARDASGKVMANTDILVEASLYKENDAAAFAVDQVLVTTNSAGVFVLTLSGALFGDLNAEVLAKGEFHIGLKFNGNDVDFGTTKLLSVPFALVANKLPNLDPIAQVGQLGSGKELPASFFTADENAPNFVWYPRKNAFKVGTGIINEDSFGEGSIGLGIGSISPGSGSVAIGTGAVARIANGTVLGNYNDISLPVGDNLDNQRLLQVGNGSSSNNRKNALTILKNGNVGVGSNTLEPEHLLDLGGRMRIKNSNSGTAGLFLDGEVTDKAAFIGMKNNTEVGFFIGGGWKFWVNSGGEGFLTNILHDSDRRLKRDFAPLSNSLFKIDNLQGQHYFWKDTTKTQLLQTGLIAQDVEEYFPELVTTNEKGFKSVNYIGLIPHLIESVKALKAKDEEFAALQKELLGYKTLQNQIDELKAELSKQAASTNSTNQTTQTK
ncbi:tail fiber domain-containing protein [Dyadobacter sp. CY343]|uniref:tail fiber domain-containing protein n=1 Tax=Dyadobacter sp. CY343 TaxID=2907299 RepID=UPI001F2105E0|nr:tail fiber domain-containing protein [Dyadobacter sp. CY343]MCE7060086.1 tail fiber domain-containing protein [Dyadobacter sp. CY343]